MNLFALFVVLVICAGQSELEPQNEDTSPLQQVVDDWMASHATGAVSVVLVSANSTRFLHSGNLLPMSPSAPNLQTMFEIGSVTKGFNGLLLADQVFAGKVQLNDTLSELLTDWPGRSTSAAGNVTLLQLATHSSGLARLPGNMDIDYLTQHANNPYAVYTTKELYEWLDSIENLTPGSYSYSNAGVGILGHALTLAAKKSYEELLKERVLEPLGLNSTTITLDDDQKDLLAPGHDASGQAVQNWDFDVLAPCGALRSNIRDLGHFLQFATGIDKRSVSLKEILAFAVRNWGNTTSNSMTIGLGWHQLLQEGKPLHWHNGGTAGYSSFVGWYSEEQKGVAVISSITTIGHNKTVDGLAIDLLRLM